MTGTIRLKNIAKLFLLSIAMLLIATIILPDTFADEAPIGQDDSAFTPVAHLEDRLLELETSRRVLSSEINEMGNGSAAFEAATADLALIDDEIEVINNQMNQIWSAYNQDELSVYNEYDADADDLDELAYEPYEPFSPYFDEPPLRMSDTEIAEFADVAIGLAEVEVHEISTAAQLRNFLNGTLGENHDHFRLTADIDVVDGSAGFLTTGRPGVFTGVFCGYDAATGGNFTITNLRLRATRAPAVTGITDDAAVGVGFVQQAGSGAVIRNVNFTTTTAADATRGAHFTAAHARGVGMVIGSTTAYPAGVATPVTIDNVHLVGALQMTYTGAAVNSGSWGGMVGRVANNTALNIRDVSVGNVQMHTSNVTGTLDSAGGLVGSVNGGRLNVTTNERTANNIDVDMRGESRGSAAGPASGNGLTSGPVRGGGVLGFIFSGHVSIYDTTVTSTRNAADPIRALGTTGGIVGGLNVMGTLRLNNVENQAMLQVQRQGGDGRVQAGAPAGRVGGLVGHSGGTLHISNSRNYGVVQHQGNRATAGGLLGYGGTSSIIVITNSRNNGPLHHRNTNAGGTHNIGTFASMGGIIGRSRGRVIIENTTNHGHIHKATLTNTLVNRDNTGLGGIIGRATLANGQALHLTNVRNHSQITISSPFGRNAGLIGELINPPRGVGNVALTDVRNYEDIIGGRTMGGIIGMSRPRDVVIRNAVNYGDLIRHSTGARPIRAGGIVGRAGGSGVRIETARNYGSITNLAANGTAAADTVDGATHAGGIIGHSSGVRLIMNDVYNEGDVRGRDNAGGILGFAGSNDASINFAINHGEVYASRSGGAVRAGGIVGFSRRRNMLIRNAGNFGNVRLRGGNNNGDGVAGVLGRSQGANARIEISFNQGTISGRNSAGGIVGRNQGALNITDVYNIGQVTGHATSNSTRSGNGVLGRRRTGTVRITRAWVSARVGGYAVATSQSGTGQQNANGSISGITFSGVFVDGTTFVTTGTDFQANNPAIQRNRNGISEVDTELLTSGFLPGFNSGPWRTGIAGVDLEYQRTYPYFSWQIPGGNDLQQPFFSFIRSNQPFEELESLEEELDQLEEEEPEYSYEDDESDYPYEDDELDQPYDEAESIESLDDEELIALLEEELIALLEEEGFALLETDRLTALLEEEGLIELFKEGGLVALVEDGLITLLEEEELIEPLDGDERDQPYEEESDQLEEDDELDQPYEEDEYESIEPLEEGYRWRPVMDLLLPSPEVNHQIDFDFSCDFVEEFDLNIPCEPLSRLGTRVFNTYIANGFTAVPVGVATHNINLTRAGYTSIGLISNNGVVGFEARDVVGRIIIRGYDPLFGENPNYYIDHAYFKIVSADASEVDLNSLFMECTINADPCPPEQQVDTMRGLGHIRFVVDDNDPTQIIQGLNPRTGPAYNPNSASSEGDVTASLADYTVVRITALGYRPVYRIIYTGDMNHLSTGVISVPMERVPFPIRVWVPQTSDDQGQDVEEDENATPLIPGPPGTPGVTNAATTPINARPGFPVLSGHTPGSFLARDPILNHTSNTPGHNHGTGASNTNTVETGDAYPSGHFEVRYAMWGDTFVATAPQHTTNTLEVFRFEHLIDRNAGTVSTPNIIGSAVDEPILDLDLYIENLGLPLMYFRFVEITGIDEDGDLIFRNLSIDGTNAAGSGIMPVIELTIHDEPGHSKQRFNTNTSVHVPQYANNNGGNAVWLNQFPALASMGTPTPHIRVEGIAETTTFSVTDATGEFLPLTNVNVSDYFRWFEPLINIDEARADVYGELFTFADTRTTLAGNNARTPQLEAALESGERGDPYLIRTLIIPLIRLREFEVRVVERVAPGEYVIIEHSTLDHNSNPLAYNPSRPGTFTMQDEGFNLLEADAVGFYPEELNAYTDVIHELLVTDDDGNSYIRIVLEPRFLEVTFDLQDGVDEDDFPSQTVRHGLTAVAPTDPAEPTREGYRFEGWYTAPTGGTEFDFETPITEDMTIYARWSSVTNFEFTKMDDLLYTDFAEAAALEGAMFNLYVRKHIEVCDTWSSTVTPDPDSDGEDDIVYGTCYIDNVSHVGIFDEDDYIWLRIATDVESDEDGLVQFGALDSGNLFRLVETAAPEDFRLPEGHWYIDIAADRTITITRSLDDEDNEREDVPFELHDEDWFVGNMPLEVGVEFRFTKTNEYLYTDMDHGNFAHLDGAEFTLRRYEGDGEWSDVIETVLSEEDGSVVFEYLLTLDGIYRLDETRPPRGFRPPQGYWVITWDDDDEKFVIDARGTVSLVPAFREVEDDLYVGNFRETVLPSSGGLGTITLTVIGVLALVAVVLWYIRRKITDDLESEVS